MGSLANWKPFDRAVQPEIPETRFLSGQFTMIAAGPPRLSYLGGASQAAINASANNTTPGRSGSDWAYPIGVLQGVQVGQQKAWSRFFELGSQRSYFIPGRDMGSLQLTRVMMHGPSLLRLLYAYYNDSNPPYTFDPLFDSSAVPNEHDVRIPAGFQNIFLNLASDLFNQPIGLLMYMRDSDEKTLATTYFEHCTIPNHNFGVDASSLVMQESCALQFERMVPVNAQNEDLITYARLTDRAATISS